MTRNQVIERLCILQRNVSDVLGWEHAADCFCDKAEHEYHYQNQGLSLEFIEQATRAALAQRKGEGV